MRRAADGRDVGGVEVDVTDIVQQTSVGLLLAASRNYGQYRLWSRVSDGTKDLDLGKRAVCEFGRLQMLGHLRDDVPFCISRGTQRLGLRLT